MEVRLLRRNGWPADLGKSPWSEILAWLDRKTPPLVATSKPKFNTGLALSKSAAIKRVTLKIQREKKTEEMECCR